MNVRTSTTTLLATLDAFSGHKLSRKDDLGALIELAEANRQNTTFDELAFLAKFVHRTYGIMKRIGKDGEGYHGLHEQFTSNLAKAKELVGKLADAAPAEVHQHFASTYLALTPSALENLLALFYDLSWYKNWEIDTGRRPL